MRTLSNEDRMGRVAYARIAPDEDLVLDVEKLCLAEGFANAFVRGALGSLVDACVGTHDGQYRHIKGPAVEIVSLAGEVRAGGDGSVRAALSGVVADRRIDVQTGFIEPGNVSVSMILDEYWYGPDRWPMSNPLFQGR